MEEEFPNNAQIGFVPLLNTYSLVTSKKRFLNLLMVENENQS